MHAMPTLRQARANDWDVLRGLLQGADLPVADLGPERLDGFLIAEDEGRMVGLIGLEAFGTLGLLRSLVVLQSARKSGVGSKLLGALEAAAAAAGIVELWLLTIDAERFFERHDFQIVERAQAPDEIRGTSEFSDLCPATARLMRKALNQPGPTGG
jgi:amino-acid N-acetyltransferase